MANWELLRPHLPAGADGRASSSGSTKPNTVRSPSSQNIDQQPANATWQNAEAAFMGETANCPGANWQTCPFSESTGHYINIMSATNWAGVASNSDNYVENFATPISVIQSAAPQARSRRDRHNPTLQPLAKTRYTTGMCRNIRTLFNFERPPPTTKSGRRRCSSSANSPASPNPRRQTKPPSTALSMK